MSRVRERRVIRRKIKNAKRRIDRREDRLAALQDVTELELRGRLKTWVEAAIERDGSILVEADKDQNGELNFKELVDFLKDEADDLIEGGVLVEAVSDFGLEVVARIAVRIYQNTEDRVEQRLLNAKKRLARLEAKLAELSV